MLIGLGGGCPQSRPLPLTHGSIEHDGGARTYKLYVPSAYDERPSDSFALLLAFHGAGGDGEAMRALTGYDAVAETEGFLACFPDGLNGNWNDGRVVFNPGIDDVGYIRALLADLGRQYRVDPKRIYATGMSNGGHFCYRLAFDLSDEIAAVAPVAALLSENLYLRDEGPPKPVPIQILVGDADPISPYNGGIVQGLLMERGEVVSAQLTVAYWKAVNRTNPDPVVTYDDVATSDRTRARRETYAPQAGGDEVVFIDVEGGGHAWPQGPQYLPEPIIGRISQDFSASLDIWRFLSRHSLP